MVIIELAFLAGRYHATPWGRNVNEGEVEWPPSPLRLARALMDVWYRRFPDISRERMADVLSVISAQNRFAMPPATSAHVCSYLHTNDKNGSRQLVFDAFVVIDRSTPLFIGFDVEPEQKTLDDLDTLLSALSYLGRSESWIKARVLPEQRDVNWNCSSCLSSEEKAGAQAGLASGMKSRPTGEEVLLGCLTPEKAYLDMPRRPQAMEVKKGKLVETGKAMEWLDAVGFSTARMLEEGWSEHPVLAWTSYIRPRNSLQPLIPKPKIRQATCRAAHYAITAKVLPRVEDTLPFADRVRKKLMGIHRRVMGGDPAAVSEMFSGKSPDGEPLTGHLHAFFLPMDLDGDGRLDHLRIQAGRDFTPDEVQALDRLTSVWQSGQEDAFLILTELHAAPKTEMATTWRSVTPFVTTRHYRKGRGEFGEWLFSEVARECFCHGLPAPVTVDAVDATPGSSRKVRWWEFKRNRKDAKPMRGHGFILKFAEPVQGPFSLGAGCHYGLGLFTPDVHARN